LRVGNAEDHIVRTGVTVVMAEALTTAVVDVRGGAPGTRDTEALDPVAIDGGCDAIVLSGGSVYGLDAPSGVTALLRAQGRGVAFGGLRLPIVPGAILFDMVNGGDKNWGDETPYRRWGARRRRRRDSILHWAMPVRGWARAPDSIKAGSAARRR
jgi:L-aminopeptidase/D-esterase-like protein